MGRRKVVIHDQPVIPAGFMIKDIFAVTPDGDVVGKLPGPLSGVVVTTN